MSFAILRSARAADLDALVRLEHGFPGERLNRRSLARLLARPTVEIWVADGEVRVLGDAVVLYRCGSRLARLYSLIVAPAARGRGFGTALLELALRGAVARGCRRLALEVREDNAAALTLYRAHGFYPVRAIPGYYEDGCTGLRMERGLAGACADADTVPFLSQVA